MFTPVDLFKPSDSVSWATTAIKPYLINARKQMRVRLTTQPAVAKALGIVRAPVPTIRLNMYTMPTCMGVVGWGGK